MREPIADVIHLHDHRSRTPASEPLPHSRATQPPKRSALDPVDGWNFVLVGTAVVAVLMGFGFALLYAATELSKGSW